MKFIDLHINGFGKFHDRTISFDDGLNIIYGRNEAGKSTIHTFIRGMLYGIQPQRGRASKNDLYSKYEPWVNSSEYGGTLRLEYNDHIYRIERNFNKANRSLSIVDETLGLEEKDPQAFLDEVLCGLTETAYTNTISIGQLKSATDEGMVSELKNYIANMNTTGNMALNITKATAYLKNERKAQEAKLIPEAAKSYTSLVSEIKTLEKEIASPEYENQLAQYQKLRSDTAKEAEDKQAEKEELLQKAARGRQILNQNQFTNVGDVEEYEEETLNLYHEYEEVKNDAEKISRKLLTIIPFILTAVLIVCGAAVLITGFSIPLGDERYIPAFLLAVISFIGAAIFAVIGITTSVGTKALNKELDMSEGILKETFTRHLGDSDLSNEGLIAFEGRMSEFKRLCLVTEESEAATGLLTQEISKLQDKQEDCNEEIEKQQKAQWELEKKLELLANYKTQAEALRSELMENDKISQEIAAIDLAQETMTELSTTIRDSFGLYLNKSASDLIAGITGGIYTSVCIDENLDVYMNTPTKLVPLRQVSSGTMDQIYLALRLAAARLMQGDNVNMPLIFDDSFVQYDDERLKSVLKWLSSSWPGQILLFTCHQREAQMMTANQIPYNLINI